MALLVHGSSAPHIPTATEDERRMCLVSADPDQFSRNEAVMLRIRFRCQCYVTVMLRTLTATTCVIDSVHVG